MKKTLPKAFLANAAKKKADKVKKGGKPKSKAKNKKNPFVKEHIHLNSFIKAITEKKYNDASKYLSQDILARIEKKILASI